MVTIAISRHMSTYCLTEHMPREKDDLYPEEIERGQRILSHRDAQATSDYLFQMFDDYYHEAIRLRHLYGSQINILIGVEVDWIRPSSKVLIQKLQEKYMFDLFIGSVHHVHGTPIDYTPEMYAEARDQSGGSIERLYEDYFDLQYEMLQALKPPVIGHFDLIRLKSERPDASFKLFSVAWGKAMRNLDFTIGYGGIIELNTAALRKGLKEPYPSEEVCRVRAYSSEILNRGGRFTLSDDAHGIDQIGTNYSTAMNFAQTVGITSLTCLKKGPGAKVTQTDFEVHELLQHRFFAPKPLNP